MMKTFNNDYTTDQEAVQIHWNFHHYNFTIICHHSFLSNHYEVHPFVSKLVILMLLYNLAVFGR